MQYSKPLWNASAKNKGFRFLPLKLIDCDSKNVHWATAKRMFINLIPHPYAYQLSKFGEDQFSTFWVFGGIC